MKKNLCLLLVAVMMLGIGLQPVVMAAPSPWAEEEIGKAIEAEVVTDSVMKDYQANITREKFCELVVKGYERITGEEAREGSILFSDTKNSEIRKAANLGIVAGYGDGRFGPNDFITREQIAAMLVRMIVKAVSYADINAYDEHDFEDGSSISEWAVPAVNFAYDKGIIAGVGDGCIAPLANTTCEQAILLVYRTVKKYAGSANVFYLGTEHTKIDDEDDAKKLIKRKSQEIGIGNVDEELEYTRSEEAMGDTFYHFRQMYEGYSVYGRSVTVGVDSSGYAVALSDNYMPMEVDLSVEVEKSEIPELVEDYYDGEATSYLIHGLTIYSLEDLHSELCWKVSVTIGQESELLFISANDGEIVDSESMIYYDTVTGHGKDIDGDDCKFNTYTEDGKLYYLEDWFNNIKVYDAKDKTLNSVHIMVDEQGRLYRADYDRKIWIDENGDKVKYETNSDDGTFTITRSGGSVITDEARPAWYLSTGKDNNSFPEKLKRDLFCDNVFSSVSEVTNRSTAWNNPKAVTMMDRITKLNEFYWEVFERRGYNDFFGNVTAVINDNMNGKKNAYSKQDWNGVTLLSFSTSMPLSSDVIGHEYRHSVTDSIKDGLAYKGESGALNEAYSDIFGELFEDWMDNGELDNSCDWINGDDGRNLSSPLESKNPFSYKGSFWADTTDEDDDHGGVHKNSTVISHAAYLMSDFGDGAYEGTGLEPLTNSQLAELFNRTSPMLPRNCTFSEFSENLFLKAIVMFFCGEIEEGQLLNVHRALDWADLAPTKQGISGRVVDENGNGIAGAELVVSTEGWHTSFFSTDENGNFSVSLPPGTSVFTIEAEGYCSEEREVKLGFKEHVVLDDIILEKDTNDEDRLLNAFVQQVVGYNSDYLYFLPDDYDGDGTLEAFGITGGGLGEEIHSNVNIWFIDSELKCVQVASNLYGSLHDTVDAGNQKFIVWEKTAGGSGSASYIYGYNNKKVYEPEISGYYEWFRYDNGEYYAEKGDFSKGYHDWITYEFIYDSAQKQFIVKSD